MVEISYKFVNNFDPKCNPWSNYQKTTDLAVIGIAIKDMEIGICRIKIDNVMYNCNQPAFKTALEKHRMWEALND